MEGVGAMSDALLPSFQRKLESLSTRTRLAVESDPSFRWGDAGGNVL